MSTPINNKQTAALIIAFVFIFISIVMNISLRWELNESQASGIRFTKAVVEKFESVDQRFENNEAEMTQIERTTIVPQLTIKICK